MKNLRFIFIIVLIIVSIFVIGYFYEDIIMMARPYVSVISDVENNYRGTSCKVDHNSVNWQEQREKLREKDSIKVDLNNIAGVSLIDQKLQKKYYFSSYDKNYAVFYAGESGGGLKILNLKNKTLETFTFPEKPAWTVDYTWIGNKLLLYYFSGENNNIKGHFYFFNPETKQFFPIKTDLGTFKYIVGRAESVTFFKKSDSDDNFAVAHCTGKFFPGDNACDQIGFSVSNGISIKKMFEIHSQYNCDEWGWKSDDFFIKINNKTYIVDNSKINW